VCERGKVTKCVYIELKSVALLKDIDLKALKLPVESTRRGALIWQSARKEWLKWLDAGHNPHDAPLVATEHRPASLAWQYLDRAATETRQKYSDLVKNRYLNVPSCMFLLMRVGVGAVLWKQLT
jgi:hypothetical protein